MAPRSGAVSPISPVACATQVSATVVKPNVACSDGAIESRGTAEIRNGRTTYPNAVWSAPPRLSRPVMGIRQRAHRGPYRAACMARICALTNCSRKILASGTRQLRDFSHFVRRPRGRDSRQNFAVQNIIKSVIKCTTQNGMATAEHGRAGVCSHYNYRIVTTLRRVLRRYGG